MGKNDGQPDERSLTQMQDARRALSTAKRELRYSPGGVGAAGAIVAGWHALAQHAGVDRVEDLAEAPGRRDSPERKLWRESLSRVRSLASQRDDPPAAESSEPAESAMPTEPTVLLELRDQIDWLSRAISARVRSRSVSWGTRIRNPSLPGALGVAAVVALALAALAAEPATPRPWRAAFHSGLDLSSEAVIRQLPRLDFAWGQRSPVPGVSANGFSVRFDACLTVPGAASGAVDQGLPRSTDVRFRLRSDDGARLWLDGRTLLAGWQQRGASQQEGDASLAPGRHHLRIEYRDIRGNAQISLELVRAASDGFSGEDRRIPDSWLAAPPEPFDSADPCRVAERGQPE